MAAVSSKSIGSKRDIVLNPGDRFVIESKIDIDTLLVPKATGNAVDIGPGGGGEIGHWELHTWDVDAIRTGPGKGTIPFVVHSGYVELHKRSSPTQHQDAWQAGGGQYVTLRRQIFYASDSVGGSTQGCIWQGFSGGNPTDQVLEDSIICGYWSTDANVGTPSTRCGVRNVLMTPDKNKIGFRVESTATTPVKGTVKTVPLNDPVIQACIKAKSVDPWLGGGTTPTPTPTPTPEPTPTPTPTPISDAEKIARMWDEMLQHGWTP